MLTIEEADDDEQLEEMFAGVLTALEDGSPSLRELWQAFDADLRAHMDEEESRVTPKLAAFRLRDALAILQEHRHLRGRLSEMGEAVARGMLRLENARSFRDELRAHARHERAILRALAGGVDIR